MLLGWGVGGGYEAEWAESFPLKMHPPLHECAALYLRKGCCWNPGTGRGAQHSQRERRDLEILAAVSGMKQLSYNQAQTARYQGKKLVPK